jgi:glycosyltransferase involved in cell wall biosynthesis
VAGRLPWPVKIAGATQEDGRASSDRAGELGGAELLGRLPADALAALYAEAGIYALPARYEPFGLTVLEAALSGCALVLGDVPSLRELWDRAALFVPPDDPDALADALVALAEAPAVRAALGRRAAARARRYGAATMIDGYLTLYSAMMARRARPRPAKEIAPACAS